MAEHPKSKSTGGFYPADVPPCRNVLNLFSNLIPQFVPKAVPALPRPPYLRREPERAHGCLHRGHPKVGHVSICRGNKTLTSALLLDVIFLHKPFCLLKRYLSTRCSCILLLNAFSGCKSFCIALAACGSFYGIGRIETLHPLFRPKFTNQEQFLFPCVWFYQIHLTT